MEDKLKNYSLLPKGSFMKDFLWYFVGSFVPLLIGFIKTPIFTRHFSSEAFGSLGMITITFTFLGMFLFSWIGSCIWRYYGKYHKNNTLATLYTNLIFLYFISFLVLAVLSVLWFFFTSDDLLRQLIFYSFLQLIFNQLFLFYMVVVRLMGKARFYTIVHSFRSVAGLAIALYLVFRQQANIDALISSLVLVDAILLLLLLLFNPARIALHFLKFDSKVIMELLKYGSLGLVLNVSLLAITYSDRYVIAMYDDLGAVGIYDQVYKISQLSVMGLITVFFNTINPKLLKVLELDFKGALILIRKYIFSFVIFGVPLVFYMALFSQEIATLLLGKEFREGYVLMPFIFAATFLHGISNFFELRLKFSHKLKRLGLIAVSSALFNIVMNLIFVGLFGYQWAAYTTLLSYTVMILIFYYWDREVLKALGIYKKEFLRMVGLLTIQYIIYEFFVDKFGIQPVLSIGIGLIFALMYIFIFRKTIRNLEIPVK